MVRNSEIQRKVRLKGAIEKGFDLNHKGFNSSMVRLKDYNELEKLAENLRFNSGLLTP